MSLGIRTQVIAQIESLLLENWLTNSDFDSTSISLGIFGLGLGQKMVLVGRTTFCALLSKN